MEGQPQMPTGFDRPRVDPGALALATVAGAVAFILGPGEWDLLAVVVGVMLLCILLAHHIAAPAARTPRSLLLRGAFGATTGLAFCIATAPAIQHFVVTPYFHSETDDGFSDDAWHTTVVLAVMWFFVATLITVWEPRIARWLDTPRRRSATDQS
ncbi:hypothetical protein [Mycolicibacterium vaccae]|jgi:hypothetical protein|uniref:Uncharacterized protein n=1 Tax=Mycolicibacterium vaccae ATCC 25954 TaxID=1194972 RepID=K0UXV3_MYCVA|nr:hypothetical protein [Mycolicibacterium vaccae]ANI40409.1 hypothetical protein MYVA_3270 [Mycolicibacterium vaccae 95051]EJZ09885.1 hypothetical protein MVAC_11402 [Mycolicibacterium vaccae ATCC 25954]MCV7060475.1 hypothetical protein [Mycolicibacterium vaccae]